MKKIFAILALLSTAWLSTARAQVSFVDTGKAEHFVDLDAHLLVGGSYITENYSSCFPQITDLNNSMGLAWGVGAKVEFSFNKLVGLATELNFLFNTGKMDMIVTNDGLDNVSNIFLKNSYRVVDIPVYASFSFNLAAPVVWDVDAGFYISYGASGSQKGTIYNGRINELGQLITTVTHLKSDFYTDKHAFINSYRTFDTGLHLGTGITFSRKVSVGVRSHIGFRNVAITDGVVRPSAHNINFFVTAGYHF